MPKSKHSVNVINGTKWIDIKQIRAIIKFEEIAKKKNINTYSVIIEYGWEDETHTKVKEMGLMVNRNKIYYEYDEEFEQNYAWVDPIASIDLNTLELIIYK